MNKLLKMSLMAVTLGLGSTAVFASEDGGDAPMYSSPSRCEMIVKKVLKLKCMFQKNVRLK